MRKILVILFVLSEVALMASKPLYMNKRWDIGGMPSNSVKLDSIEYSGLNLHLNSEEIKQIIQIQNITVMGDLFGLNLDRVDVNLVGNFIIGGNSFIIYDVNYGYDGSVQMLACINKGGGLPKTLVIGRIAGGCHYVDYEYSKADNVLKIRRLFRSADALGYYENFYKLDKEFTPIREELYLNFDYPNERYYCLEKLEQYGTFEKRK